MAMVLALLVSSVAGCTPTERIVEKEVEKVVTQQVEKVVTKEVEKQVVVTATPEPALGAKLPIAKMRLALNGPVPTMDTYLPMLGPAGEAVLLATGHLFRFDKSKTPLPDLVDTYSISADGLVWTMKLHANLKYHDGTPLKAADVVYSFNRIKDAAPTNKTLIKNITNVEAPDNQTVVWTLSQPERELPSFFANYFCAIHPQDKVEADKDYFMHPLSAGCYYIKEGKPGDPVIVLAENPNYVHGPMAIQTIELVVTPDMTSRTLQLGQGDVDFVYELPPAVRGVLAKGVSTSPFNIGGMIGLVFNLRMGEDTPVGNNKVRQAISLALDRDEISTKAFFGVATAAKGVCPDTWPEFVPLLANGGKQDLAAAKALLAGTPCENGCDMTLQTWSDRGGWPEAATVVKEQLAKININVTIDSVTAGVSMARMDKGDFEFCVGGMGLGRPARIWLSNQYVPGSFWTDKAAYKSAEMVALFDQAARAADEKQYLEATTKIQELGLKDMPLIPMLNRNVLIGTRLPDNVFAMVDGSDIFWTATMSEAQ